MNELVEHFSFIEISVDWNDQHTRLILLRFNLPQTAEDLTAAAMEEWNNIPQEVINCFLFQCIGVLMHFCILGFLGS